MACYTRRIFKYSFNIAASSATTTVNLNPDDLSTAKSLTWEISFSTIDTDAGDTLNVKLQDTNDGTTWNTRARFPQFTGNQSPTEVWRQHILNSIPITTDDSSQEPTGSAGATELLAGLVLNGPFPGLLRTTAGGRLPSWRVQFVAVDADSDASWIGTLTISVTSEVN